MDAPKLVLPEGVGFKVGGDTGVNYLVLQVHYANVDKFLSKLILLFASTVLMIRVLDGATDNSGIILTLLDGKTDK